MCIPPQSHGVLGDIQSVGETSKETGEVDCKQRPGKEVGGR